MSQLKMSHLTGSGSSHSWAALMQQAEADHRAWLQTLAARIAEDGMEAIVQRYWSEEVSANELFHCLIIAGEFPKVFVSLACELILSREGSSIGREFLKAAGDEDAVPALRQLLHSEDTNDVYWALDALKNIRCDASIEAVRSFENHAEPSDADDPWACNFLEGQRQEALDVLEDKEKPYHERVRDDIRAAIRIRGAEYVVQCTEKGRWPADEVFLALRELGEFPANGVALALTLSTHAALGCHQRREPIYFLCEYRGEDTEALLFQALEAQLEIHFSGGEAWAEGCVLLAAIGVAGSEAAIHRLETIELARGGGSNANTIDLEEERQAAMKALRTRFAASPSE